MARAFRTRWLRLFASLAAGVAGPALGAWAQEPVAPEPGYRSVVITPAGKASQAHIALSKAVEFMQHGDYEAAEPLFREAEVHQDDLNPTERTDLMRLESENARALTARRTGVELLHQADKALAEKRNDDVQDLLRKLAPSEQYLATADRVHYEQLAFHGHGHIDSYPPTNECQAKLRQARALLGRYDFDGAEALANEASHMHATPVRGDDTPQAVLQDIARSKADPKVMLLAARAALQSGKLERAEVYAQLAAKEATMFSFGLMASDTPAKLLKDIQAARLQSARKQAEGSAVAQQPHYNTQSTFAPATPPKPNNTAQLVATNAPPTPPVGGPNLNASALTVPPLPANSSATPTGDRPLSNDANVIPPASGPALPTIATGPPPPPPPVAGTGPLPPAVPVAVAVAPSPETEKARQLLAQARVALSKKDYVLARQLADQARALKPTLAWFEDSPATLIAQANLLAAAKPAIPTTTTGSRAEALILVKQGRDLLAQGKLDEASQAANRARAMVGITWGLFEDTPEKLFKDVEKIRTKRDYDESFKVLAEARKLYEAGEYDKAKLAAYKARKLHGPYTIMELGDRPDKLLVEIEVAQSRARHLAAANSEAGSKAAEAKAEQARKMLADARAALKAGDTPKAQSLALQVRAMNVALLRPNDDSPDKVLHDADMVRANPNAIATGILVPPQTTNVADTSRAQSDKLLAQARSLQKEGRFIEAYQTALQAQKLNAVYKLDEDNPSSASQQIMAQARGRFEHLLLTADDLSRSPGDTVLHSKEAEENLMQARQLAAAFRQDTQPVDLRLIRLQQLRAVAQQQANTPPVVVAQIPPVVLPPVLPTPVPPSPVLPEIAQKPVTPTPLPAGPAIQPPVLPDPTLPLLANQIPAISTPLPQITPPAVQQPVAQQPVLPAQPTPVPTVVAQLPHGPGHVMLDKARLELQYGQVSNARRICEEVLSSNDPASRAEAMAVLNTVEAEENNQRMLEACRAFDAAAQAYNRREFNTASGILATIDGRLLDPGRQSRLREIMMQPDMQPRRTEIAQNVPAKGPVQNSAYVTGPSPAPQAGTGEAPAHSLATDDPAQDVLARTKSMREIHFQQMREEGMKTMSLATEKFRAGEVDAAIAMLQGYVEEVNKDTELDPGQQKPLLTRQVTARVKSFELSREQQSLIAGGADARAAHKKQLIQEGFNAEQLKQKKVAEMMKQFNALYKNAKYEEAERYALLAKEVDPDNPVVTAAVIIARNAYRRNEYQQRVKDKDEYAVKELNKASELADPRVLDDDMVYPRDKKSLDRLNKHIPINSITVGRKTDKDREIENKLHTTVSMNFTDLPLGKAIDDLSTYQGINIYVDRPALLEEGVSLEQPVTLRLDQISLKSALNLLLHQAKLTWVVKDEVLQVTTERAASGKLETRTYEVADLVNPIPDFGSVTGPRPGAVDTTPPVAYGGGGTPLIAPYGLINGQNTGTPSNYGGSSFGTDAGNNGGQYKKSNATNTREAELIKLLTSTIQPRSWADMGGPGTIEYYPPTAGLVINQTGDIQEQIADLLAALRRLQDQEVAVEVRFISISEDFYERIGVSFNANIQMNQNSRFQPSLITGNFGQPGFLNQFSPSHFISGLVNPGELSPDLGIPITNPSFSQNIPEFGGYAPGLQLGVAFLSDIQVFLFMEAAQGDTRTNIMQAPKLTLFNGQTATLQVGDTQTFVTNIMGNMLQNGSIIFTPQTQAIPDQTSLTIQAVISADRRFVRLSLNPTLTNLAPGPVNLFPVVVPFFPQPVGLQAANPVGAPILLTQEIQQPITDTITVETTVAVPDGGTVVLGGMKRLSEERSESGPPIVSKIPYISRLFKNTAYGRETESLLIMVTPRIIIQEEEEIRQTGFTNATPGQP